MALISGTASTRSHFPDNLDGFSPAVDGTGDASVINAERFNNIEASIFQAQTYLQPVIRVAGSSDRYLVRKVATEAVTGGVKTRTVVISLSAAEVLRLGGIARPGNVLVASAYRSGGDEGVRACPIPKTGSNTDVEIVLARTDRSNLTTGTYYISLEIIGG